MYYCIIRQERIKKQGLNWAIRIRQDGRLIGRTKTKLNAEAIMYVMNEAYKDVAQFIVFPWEQEETPIKHEVDIG